MSWGPLFEKAGEGKNKETEENRKFFYLHINCRNVSYAQKAKC